MKNKVLELGQRVYIKSMTIDEVRFMLSWDEHEDMIFSDYNFPILTKFEQIEWFKSKTFGNKRLFSIYDFQKNYIGYISLRNFKILSKSAEFGIVLNPKHIDHGYGKDALTTLFKWYFTKLKYRKIFLTVALYNKRALHLYKSLGFKYDSFKIEIYDNPLFDPFSAENIDSYGEFFEKKYSKIYSKCIRMSLTKESFLNYSN